MTVFYCSFGHPIMLGHIGGSLESDVEVLSFVLRQFYASHIKTGRENCKSLLEATQKSC